MRIQRTNCNTRRIQGCRFEFCLHTGYISVCRCCVDMDITVYVSRRPTQEFLVTLGVWCYLLILFFYIVVFTVLLKRNRT